MLRHGRKAAYRRFVFPKRLLSPRGTRAAGHIVPTHTMLRAALKLGPRLCHVRALLVPTHNAACGIETTFTGLVLQQSFVVPTHIMPRAALKRGNFERLAQRPVVPTHTMLRAALKQLSYLLCRLRFTRPDTYNAACGIDNKTALRVHIGHTEPFSYAKSAQQSLTMRRTDGSIEIQKGHCRSRLPNNRMKFPPTVWKLKADFSYLSSNDDHQ